MHNGPPTVNDLPPELLLSILQSCDTWDWPVLRQVLHFARTILKFLADEFAHFVVKTNSRCKGRDYNSTLHPACNNSVHMAQVCWSWKRTVGKATTKLKPSTLNIDFVASFPNLRCLDLGDVPCSPKLSPDCLRQSADLQKLPELKSVINCLLRLLPPLISEDSQTGHNAQSAYLLRQVSLLLCPHSCSQASS